MSRTDVLVDADWVEAHLDDPKIALVEVDEDTTAYDKNHIRSAIKIDWKQDLQDQVRRDFVNKAQFEALLSAKGIANDDTVVLYGGNNNWFAAYAYWYFTLYGHDAVKLLDGGRKKWELDSRELVTDAPQRAATTYTAKDQDTSIRAFRDDVFKSDDDLRALYEGKGVDLAVDTVAYCRIGERSAHTWFALHELLGVSNVKNYDGSWTEWGSLVGVPVQLGDEPGSSEGGPA